MSIYVFLRYFLMFLFYSFLGWTMEVIVSLIEKKKLVNRGFLLGPYCPIYGCGMLLIVFLLRNYTDSPLALFILAMVICMALEYATSFLMELIFKARWWDYSNKKYNINGRICLETAIPFGIGGTLIMYVVHPFITSIVSRFSNTILLIMGITLLVIFIIDNIVSFMAMFKIKGIDLMDYVDNTEEITLKVKEYLMKQTYLTKRIVMAFPNVNMIGKKINSKKK